jgi:hypothetical protein
MLSHNRYHYAVSFPGKRGLKFILSSNKDIDAEPALKL